MPHYHFHIDDGVARRDREGLDLPNRDVAWEEAIRTYGDVLKHMNGHLRTGTELKMEVTDGGDQPVFTLRFSAEEHGGSPNLRVLEN